jgi:hypothetical protein
MVTEKPAITFNAAGLNPRTVQGHKGTWNESFVTNYRVEGGPLTADQESHLTPMRPAAGPRQVTIKPFDGHGHIIYKRQKSEESLHDIYSVFRGMLVDTHAKRGPIGQVLPTS